MKHVSVGTVSMANNGHNMHGSQFFVTLAENLTYLDDVHTVFGQVTEGLDVLTTLNETIVDGANRPYQDIRYVPFLRSNGSIICFLPAGSHGKCY